MASALITQELKATGTANVIVILERSVPPSAVGVRAAAGARGRASVASDVAGLARHFLSGPRAGARRAIAGRRPRASAAARAVVAEVRPVRHYPNLGVMYGSVDRDGLAALRADRRVSGVTGAPPLSLIRPARVAPAKLAASVTWGLGALRVPDLWKQGLSGKGVLVGHLDTGVDGKHPALRRAIAHFAEFDDLGREVAPAPKPHDPDGHGTHTAGTIVGRPVSRRHVGVAPGAKLASALVIEGGDVVARVLGGLDWAVERNVRVISMSLGLRGWWEDFLAITRILRARGVLPVFAVGNEGRNTSRSPGNYGEALSVGASDEDSAVADFSSSQRFARAMDPIVPDVVGPGVDVLSAASGGGYVKMDGSSMATPHVAGLAALLMEAKPDKTIREVEAAIFASCRRGAMKEARAGRGLPDAVRALQAL